MINLTSFNTLDKTKQTEYVWDNGVFISSRAKENYIVNLHQLDSFYVELFYCQQSNKVQKIIASKIIDSSEQYLNEPELNACVEVVKNIIEI